MDKSKFNSHKFSNDEAKEFIDDALSGAVNLGSRMQILRKGSLGCEAYLTFLGEKDEPNRYYDLSGLGHKSLFEMACVLKEVSEVLQILEEGTEEDSQKFFMENCDCDGMSVN